MTNNYGKYGNVQTLHENAFCSLAVELQWSSSTILLEELERWANKCIANASFNDLSHKRNFGFTTASVCIDTTPLKSRTSIDKNFDFDYSKLFLEFVGGVFVESNCLSWKIVRFSSEDDFLDRFKRNM